MMAAFYIIAGIAGVIGGIAVLRLVGAILFGGGSPGIVDEERAFTEHYDEREKRCASEEPLPPVR